MIDENNSEDKINSISLARWTKTTFYGWSLGIILILILASSLHSVGVEKMQFFLGLGMGASVGYMQWRLLQETFGITTGWIWSSIAGMGAPFLLFDIYSMYSGDTLGSDYLKYSIITGSVFTAVLQYFLLKKTFTNAVLWFAGCIFGWISGVATVLGIDYIKFVIQNNLALFFINLTLILGGGAVLGYVSGLFIRKLEK